MIYVGQFEWGESLHHPTTGLFSIEPRGGDHFLSPGRLKKPEAMVRRQAATLDLAVDPW